MGEYGCSARAESYTREIAGERVWFVQLHESHFGHGETEQDAMESAIRQLRGVAQLVANGTVFISLREREGARIKEEYFEFPPKQSSEE